MLHMLLASSIDSENICLRTRRKKRIGSGTTSCEVARRPRLFGGSLDEYVEITGEAIPVLITSSIRVLSQFALHHQGIFRISGSQIEINAFKEAFEKGEDPLRDVVDASDVNSVAGVLKLYLRELREPLFPIFLFDQLTKCAECLTAEGFVQQIVPLLQKLSQPTLLVLRYLFAFLNHLSEFSDENMMDPYNLAICFGPTLLPIPEGKDQVFYHNFVNELVKNLILYHDHVFPQSLSGPRYEKYLVETDHALFIDEPDEGLSGDEEGGTLALSKSVIEEVPSSANETSQISESYSSRTCSEMKGTSSNDEPSPPQTPYSDSTPVASTSYLYSSVIPHKPDLKEPAITADLVSLQQQSFSQRAPSLCSTSSSTRSGRSTGYFESAYLIRRYGSEDETSPELNEASSSIPGTSSAQIWSRRAAGASSLREQLHHTRNKSIKDGTNEKKPEGSVERTSTEQVHRHSLLVSSTVTTGTSGTSVVPSLVGRDEEENKNSVNNCILQGNIRKDNYSLRDRLAVQSSINSQFQNELKWRLGCQDLSNNTGKCMEPDLVRSLPHDGTHLGSVANTRSS